MAVVNYVDLLYRLNKTMELCGDFFMFLLNNFNSVDMN